MAFLDAATIQDMGFSSVGHDVRISDRASFYNCANIALGDNVRIDDFCILSAGQGGIAIGQHVHIAAYSSLIGAGKITIADFANISSRVSIYSSNDDYSGATMTNPTIPARYTGVSHADVRVGRHVIIGSGSVILPGASLGEGAAVGALSLIQKDCRAFGIYAGTPARFIKERKRDLLELEKQFVSQSRQPG
jgi:galactoside O-acetyltransferase